MENKIILNAEQKELTVLTGKALDPKAPLIVAISGTIDSPTRYLEKRITEIDQKKCHVIFDIESKSISLIVNETSPLDNATISGSIEISDEFKKFKINTGESWSCFDLADFIKMNRSFFESKEVAGKLVNQLRTFKAKVDKEIEQSKDDKANYSIKRSQVVNSNLPDSFTILVKIIKGQDRKNIPVEINIHPDTLNCILISPDAKDYENETVEKIMWGQKELIEKIAPEIVIFEQ